MTLLDAQRLGKVVRSFGVSARMLVLEITEQERVSDMPQLRQAINAVHACGARMALDNFGDGPALVDLAGGPRPSDVLAA